MNLTWDLLSAEVTGLNSRMANYAVNSPHHSSLPITFSRSANKGKTVSCCFIVEQAVISDRRCISLICWLWMYSWYKAELQLRANHNLDNESFQTDLVRRVLNYCTQLFLLCLSYIHEHFWVLRCAIFMNNYTSVTSEWVKKPSRWQRDTNHF